MSATAVRYGWIPLLLIGASATIAGASTSRDLLSVAGAILFMCGGITFGVAMIEAGRLHLSRWLLVVAIVAISLLLALGVLTLAGVFDDEHPSTSQSG